MLTHEDIEKLQSRRVIDVLERVPGVAVARSGPLGQTSRVFLRGAESRHTLVIIDGVVVNDPSDTGNTYDFAHLTTDNIERIEVLRGPQSTLYGSDAIGGVITIVTKEGRGKPSADAALEVGSFDTYRVAAGTSGALERLSYSLQLSELDTRGISAFNERRGATENDPYENTVLSARLGADVTDHFSLSLAARAQDSTAEFDAFGADNLVNVAKTRQGSGRLSGALELLDGRWRQEIGLALMDVDRKSLESTGNSEFKGGRRTLDWVHHYQPVKEMVLTAGAEASREEFKSDSVRRRTVDNKALFGQAQWDILERLTALLGLRRDDHETFGGKTTWRVTPSYWIARTATRLKGSIGTGFKAPSLFQLYSSFGNTSLKPETSKGYDAGFEQSLWDDRVMFGSSWFDNDIQDLIDYDFVTDRYLNIGKARTRGVESTLTVRATDRLTLNLSHTWLMTSDRDRQSLVRRPKHQGSALVEYAVSDRASVALGVRHTGRRDDFDLAFSRSELPSHHVATLSARWRIAEHYELFGRVENLLSKDYEEVFGFGQPGLAAYVGVRVTY